MWGSKNDGKVTSDKGQGATNQRRMVTHERSWERKARKRSQGKGWLTGRFGDREARASVWLPQKQVSKRSQTQDWLTRRCGGRKVKGSMWVSRRQTIYRLRFEVG